MGGHTFVVIKNNHTIFVYSAGLLDITWCFCDMTDVSLSGTQRRDQDKQPLDIPSHLPLRPVTPVVSHKYLSGEEVIAR